MLNSKRNINGEAATKVSVNVKNVGDLKGEEVVQLYIKDLESSTQRAL